MLVSYGKREVFGVSYRKFEIPFFELSSYLSRERRVGDYSALVSRLLAKVKKREFLETKSV
jgi:hypothetical protein